MKKQSSGPAKRALRQLVLCVMLAGPVFLASPALGQTIPVIGTPSGAYAPGPMTSTGNAASLSYTGYASYVAPLYPTTYAVPHLAPTPPQIAAPQVVCAPAFAENTPGSHAKTLPFEDCRVVSTDHAAPIYRDFSELGAYEPVGYGPAAAGHSYNAQVEDAAVAAYQDMTAKDPAVDQPMQLAWSMPQSRFKAAATVNIDLGYQLRYELQPAPTDLYFDGFAAIVIDRRNGKFTSNTEVTDPNKTLKDAYLRASAPTTGPLTAIAKLEDHHGHALAINFGSDGVSLPSTRVRGVNGLVARGTVGFSGEYAADNWAIGAALAIDVSPIASQKAPALSTANIYASTRFGTLSAGRGVGLPYATRSYEVISGGGYSFADFGTYQASYVSPVVMNTRVGLLLGLQTRAAGGSAEWQLTQGNNQFRAGIYADSARSIQGEVGYTRAFGNRRFVGGTIYAGNDGTGESFIGVQGNVDLGKHTLQANLTRVASNNLRLVYNNRQSQKPVFGLEINDQKSFNQQAQLNLEYRYSLTPNVQLYGNAEFINHRYYGSTYSYGGGVRAAF